MPLMCKAPPEVQRQVRPSVRLFVLFFFSFFVLQRWVRCVCLRPFVVVCVVGGSVGCRAGGAGADVTFEPVCWLLVFGCLGFVGVRLCVPGGRHRDALT